MVQGLCVFSRNVGAESWQQMRRGDLAIASGRSGLFPRKMFVLKPFPKISDRWGGAERFFLALRIFQRCRLELSRIMNATVAISSRLS
jgi:hypothetical protein